MWKSIQLIVDWLEGLDKYQLHFVGSSFFSYFPSHDVQCEKYEDWGDTLIGYIKLLSDRPVIKMVGAIACAISLIDISTNDADDKERFNKHKEAVASLGFDHTRFNYYQLKGIKDSWQELRKTLTINYLQKEINDFLNS